MPLPVATEYPIPGATVITTLAHDGQYFVKYSTILGEEEEDEEEQAIVTEFSMDERVTCAAADAADTAENEGGKDEEKKASPEIFSAQ